MNPKIKRLLSMLLALTMMFSLVVPVAAAGTTGKTVEIEVGESVKLGSSGWFTKTTWTSSDEAVATVSDNGTVTGVAVGTATITATSKSIFGFFGGTTTTTYTVIVTEGTTEPEETLPEVTEPEAGLTVKEGETLQLTVDADGGKTTWSSSDETVATVDENGLVTGVSEGEVTITATVTKTTGNGFWFFWWGSKTTTTKTEFQVTVLPGDEEPTEPEVPTDPEAPTDPEEPTDPETPADPEIITYTVTFESNGGSAVEAQVVEKGMTVVKPELVTKANSMFVGWYFDEALTEYVDFETWTVQADTTLYAGWIDLENVQDSDEDEIPDELEELLELDPTTDDTDGDGLTDYIEIDQLYLDPKLADTDGNGVNDGDEDNDGDGLSNCEEIALGTDPVCADSDADDLSDYAEATEYNTDPLNLDTDSDGVSDGKEIELGTDPLTAQESFELVVSSDAEDPVVASVEIELPGELVETLEIQQFVNDTFFTEEMPGYLGSAYDFSVDGDFESAVLHFTFDEALLENEAFDPVIFYFNEEEQALEELVTTVEGNVASATVEHFSTYILIDRTIYYSAFTWEDVWDTEGTFDSVEVVLVIDDSGSLGGDYTYNSDTGYFEDGNDPQHLRLAAARNFVEDSSNAAQIGIVKFDSNVETFAGLTLCDDAGKETLKNILQFTRKTSNTSGVFDSKGTTYMYTGIDTAFNLFTSAEETEDSVLRVVIVFTDGNAHDAEDHDSVVAAAIEQNIRIYTVGLGSSTSYFTNYLQPLAEDTGGSFYMTSDADQLTEIYEDIGKKIDIKTDSDNDGIPDYYEDHMVSFDGSSVVMDKYSDDTDGDGLKDGEEITLHYEYNEDETQVKVTGKMYSNPTKIDSDGDGLYDNAVRTGKKTTNAGVESYDVAPIDPEPLIYTGPRGMWKEHIATQQNASVVAGDYGNRAGFDFDLPDWADELIVNAALWLQDAVTSDAWTQSGIEKYISKVCLVIKFFCGTEAHAVVGAYLLNFVEDNLEIGYHSQPDTWQRDFGYNDFYDSVFRIGSNMGVEYESGYVGDTEYKLWMWKGDYWNLQTGAEIGLYIYDHTSSGEDHYDVVDFEMPMTLSLYNYYNSKNIDNVFNWAPEVDQWWVTGFNTDFEDPNPNDMVSVGSIDFTGHTDIYDALKREIALSEESEYYIFDTDGHTLWVMWH